MLCQPGCFDIDNSSQPFTCGLQKFTFLWVRVNRKKAIFAFDRLNPLPQRFEQCFSTQIACGQAGVIIFAAGFASLALDGLQHLVQGGNRRRSGDLPGLFVRNDGRDSTAKNMQLDGKKHDGPKGHAGRIAAEIDPGSQQFVKFIASESDFWSKCRSDFC